MLEAAWAPPSTIARDVKRIIRPHTNCYSVVAVFIVFLRAKIYPAIREMTDRSTFPEAFRVQYAAPS
eukprot:COSAG06_NODE_200_length_20386_cov_35.829547_6_plen_67_part_00